MNESPDYCCAPAKMVTKNETKKRQTVRPHFVFYFRTPSANKQRKIATNAFRYSRISLFTHFVIRPPTQVVKTRKKHENLKRFLPQHFVVCPATQRTNRKRLPHFTCFFFPVRPSELSKRRKNLGSLSLLVTPLRRSEQNRRKYARVVKMLRKRLAVYPPTHSTTYWYVVRK